MIKAKTLVDFRNGKFKVMKFHTGRITYLPVELPELYPSDINEDPSENFINSKSGKFLKFENVVIFPDNLKFDGVNDNGDAVFSYRWINKPHTITIPKKQ